MQQSSNAQAQGWNLTTNKETKSKQRTRRLPGQSTRSVAPFHAGWKIADNSGAEARE